MKSINYFRLFFFALFISCNFSTPPDLNNVIDKSGDNRSEISAVLNHYGRLKSDSLKLKAAHFLIKNLDDRFFFDGEFLTNYNDYTKLILKDPDHGEYIMSSFRNLYGVFDIDSLKVKYDLQNVTADLIISHIDDAFEVWRQQPWGKDYSFDQFCNFILPYRIADELPWHDRKSIYKKYISFLKQDSSEYDAITACKKINDQLIREGWLLTNRSSFLPHSNADHLIENRAGSCREMVDLGVYVMRALGIPVAIDFLPQWPYRRQGHTWNVVFDKNGKAIPFLGAEDSPLTPHRPNTKRGKVYRYIESVNPNSLANLVNDKNTIPDFLRNNRLIDVTQEYANVHSAEIIMKERHNYGYLSVFDNINWKPIAWSIIKNGRARFTKLEGGIIYLPSYYVNGSILPASHPIILTENGQIKELSIDTVKTIDEIICNRVYPIVPESYLTDDAKDAIIQGSNRTDFSDAVNLFTFSSRALPGWNNINLGNQTFRYYRYKSSNRNCNVAELQFYLDDKRVKVKVFGRFKSEQERLKAAIDDNELTGFEANKSSWIGIDLGEHKLINKIRFMARIDMPNSHFIIPGKKYELKYWSGSKWMIIREQVAKDKILRFKNVPANALFLLTSDNEIKDTRIFTYVNGKQVWW